MKAILSCAIFIATFGGHLFTNGLPQQLNINSNANSPVPQMEEIESIFGTEDGSMNTVPPILYG
jgi:hypothetical protein